MMRLSTKLMILSVMSLVLSTNVLAGTWSGILYVCKDTTFLSTNTVTIHQIDYGVGTSKFYSNRSVSFEGLSLADAQSFRTTSGQNTAYKYPTSIKIKVNDVEKTVTVSGFGSSHSKITLSQDVNGVITATPSAN